MAYEWTNGELITAEKLNSTGGGGVLEIQLEEDETLKTMMNKTWNEINTAFSAGKVCFVLWPDSHGYERDMVVGTGWYEDETTFYVVISRQYNTLMLMFYCSSRDGYPYYNFDY